jgi:hypothetical protein
LASLGPSKILAASNPKATPSIFSQTGCIVSKLLLLLADALSLSFHLMPPLPLEIFTSTIVL